MQRFRVFRVKGDEFKLFPENQNGQDYQQRSAGGDIYIAKHHGSRLAEDKLGKPRLGGVIKTLYICKQHHPEAEKGGQQRGQRGVEFYFRILDGQCNQP